MTVKSFIQSTISPLYSSRHSTTTNHHDCSINASNHLSPGGFSPSHRAIPLIDISTPSTPLRYSRSRGTNGAQGEEHEEYFEYDVVSRSNEIRRLEESDDGSRILGSGGDSSGGDNSWSGSKRSFQLDCLGPWLFGNWMGRQVLLSLLVIWGIGVAFGLVLMNRFILLSGVFKFPYPVTATFIQLIITHVLLIGFSSLTRGLAHLLYDVGLGGVVAPTHPIFPASFGYHNVTMRVGLLSALRRWFSGGSGGIAGDGIFELDGKVVKKVLPLAAVHVMKVLLSNLTFSWADAPIYTLSRIAIVPLTVVITSTLCHTSHSLPILSSALTATLNLLLTSIQLGGRITAEVVVAGIMSSFFAAIYPILLLRTYNTLVAGLAQQHDFPNFVSLLTSSAPSGEGTGNERAGSGSSEDTRAYYRVLHYTSVLSLLLLSPVVLLSGELRQISRHCYILDVPFFWFLILCGGIGSWAVFSSALLMVKLMGPVTTNFLGVPRAAAQLAAFSGRNMKPHGWVGVGLCWGASVWYAIVIRKESQARGVGIIH